ncbi:MAG: outer membrane protein assembly factor BamD [Cytophagales bacterium]|nr:outer membrane protein assembly factor BamD [Cytophagales bacterium]
MPSCDEDQPMMNRKKGFFWLCTMICLGSCTAFHKVKNDPDWEIRYRAAIRYYESEEYAKASLLLEPLLNLTKGSEDGERILWMYAQSLYNQKKYILSAYHFKEFTDTYIQSPERENAYFLHVSSKYEITNPHNLDANPTFEVISVAQNFLDLYPKSSYREEVQGIMDEMQISLEKKAFGQVKMYFHMEYNRATTVSSRHFREDFPDSAYVPESMYLEILAQYRWAQRSIPEKQSERYKKVLSLHERFVDLFPEDPFLRESAVVYTASQQALRDLNKMITK